MFLDQISMSCDTEDWSNDAENSAKKLHFTIYSHMGGAREGLAGAPAPPRKTKAPP